MQLMWLKQIEKCIALLSVEAISNILTVAAAPHRTTYTHTIYIYDTPMSSSSTVALCV